MLQEGVGAVAAFVGLVAVALAERGEAVDRFDRVKLGAQVAAAFGDFFDRADAGLGSRVGPPGDEGVEGEVVGVGEGEKVGGGEEEVAEEIGLGSGV